MTLRLLALFGVCLLIVGCDATDRRDDIPRQDWSSTRLDADDSSAAFDAATYAVSQWFTIRDANPADGLILSHPAEFDQRGGTERLRDGAVNYRNRVRRRAVVRVRSTGGGPRVECVVARERLDTADHRVFWHNRSFEDVPSQTPIAQEAATGPEQNEVWTDVGRDRDLERRILGVVRERLAGGPPRSEPPAPPVQP